MRPRDTRRLMADPPLAAVLAACALVLGLRRAGALSHPQFWAEDGYFYERAHVLGWRALALPYNGYLHTLPRLIAAFANLCDPALVPAVFVASAAVLTLYVASRAQSARCPLPHVAGVCALAVVLVPDTREVLLNVVNLQWVLAGGLVLLLLAREPERRGQAVHDAAAAAAFSLTGPFCIAVAPLFAWRAAHRKTRSSCGLLAVVALCAAVQAFLVLTHPAIPASGADDPARIGLVLQVIGMRIGGSIVLGSLEPLGIGAGGAVILGLGTLVGVGFLALRRGPIGRERILLGLVFALMLASAFYRTWHTFSEFKYPASASRYVYVPQLLAIWLLLAAAAQRDRVGRVAAAVAVAAVLLNLPRYREPAYADLHWNAYVPQMRAGEPVTVPINPPGWTMALPGKGK
jgi:hypothetical protein